MVASEESEPVAAGEGGRNRVDLLSQNALSQQFDVHSKIMSSAGVQSYTGIFETYNVTRDQVRSGAFRSLLPQVMEVYLHGKSSNFSLPLDVMLGGLKVAPRGDGAAADPLTKCDHREIQVLYRLGAWMQSCRIDPAGGPRKYEDALCSGLCTTRITEVTEALAEFQDPALGCDTSSYAAFSFMNDLQGSSLCRVGSQCGYQSVSVDMLLYSSACVANMDFMCSSQVSPSALLCSAPLCSALLCSALLSPDRSENIHHTPPIYLGDHAAIRRQCGNALLGLDQDLGSVKWDECPAGEDGTSQIALFNTLKNTRTLFCGSGSGGASHNATEGQDGMSITQLISQSNVGLHKEAKFEPTS